MDRTPWILASVLAIPLMAVAGCKDSKQDYISFDASPDVSSPSDAKRDGATSDAASGDTSHSDASTEALASETQPVSDAAADAGGGDDTSLDGTPDTEPGQ